MAKYRTKPKLVDAIQWHPGQLYEGLCTNNCFNVTSSKESVSFLESIGMIDTRTKPHPISPPHFHTQTGPVVPSDNDWFIKDENGSFHKYHDKDFHNTFEKVED